ncbi:Hypothetical predicted protein [Mytilus galloprovincialis]|uniref:Ig-like domain-containing protein n=1 Tax=Mytilus galloprovincialis TaxID=29158 RepID=A0A8B6BKQ3_MYTGA|nr:Hypothetical predicted protein [Mytilus galloprovincialis]
MELSKINKRLANIEEHVNKNSIDIARATSTIEKSVSDIRNPAYDKEQSEKLNKIQDTLTKVEKLCATVITNTCTVEDKQKEKKQTYDKPSTNQSHEQITTGSKPRRDNFQATETRDQDQNGIHLNQNDGIPLYVRNLKHVANPLLGVINDQQNFENHQFPRQRNQQFRRENGNHFYKRPNRYDEENHQSATYMYDNNNNCYERETNHQNASHDKHNNYYQSYDDNLSNNGINMRLLKLALEDHPDCEAKEPTLVLDKCPTDSDPPTVYVTPGNSSIHVHRHDNVTLECSFVSLTNITSFKWTKHGQTGQTIIAEITHFSGVSHSVPLVMFDFIPEDVGTYQCNVSNENGENDDKVSILIFEETPDPQISFEKYPLNLGGDVHLECMIDVYPEVTDVWWTKDDGLIDRTDSRYSGSTPQEPSLKISTTTTDDIGYYRCCANNTKDFNCSKSIIFGFTFHEQPDENVTFGEDISIDCAVDSHPPITQLTTITWSLNGSCININNTTKYLQPTPTELTIKNAGFSDKGTYTCAVENDKGNGTSSGLWLNVIGDFPSVNSVIIYNNVLYSTIVSLNESTVSTLILTCSYESFPPATDIKWEKQNDIYQPLSERATGGNSIDPNITFTSIEKSDEGNYTCFVTNAVGTRAGNSVYIQVNESIDMCTCQCSFKEKINFWKKKNFTQEEMLAYMEPSLKKVLDEMKLQKDKLSQSIRKRTSAKDDRKSSTQIGIAGVVFIGATFGLIIVIDIISIKRYVQNVREAFNIT